MHLKVLFMPNLEQQNENLSIKKTNETNQAVPKYRLLLLAFIGLIVGMAVIIFIFKGIPLSFIPNRLKPREWTGTSAESQARKRSTHLRETAYFRYDAATRRSCDSNVA